MANGGPVFTFSLPGDGSRPAYPSVTPLVIHVAEGRIQPVS